MRVRIGPEGSGCIGSGSGTYSRLVTVDGRAAGALSLVGSKCNDWYYYTYVDQDGRALQYGVLCATTCGVDSPALAMRKSTPEVIARAVAKSIQQGWNAYA